VGRDPGAVAAVTMDDLGELTRRPGEAIIQVEVLQHARAVGGERDGRADLAQVGGLFEDLGDDAAAPQQQQRQREPADPGSDDHNPRGSRRHQASLRRWTLLSG
jgi:hypothetical protein